MSCLIGHLNISAETTGSPHFQPLSGHLYSLYIVHGLVIVHVQPVPSVQHVLCTFYSIQYTEHWTTCKCCTLYMLYTVQLTAYTVFSTVQHLHSTAYLVYIVQRIQPVQHTCTVHMYSWNQSKRSRSALCCQCCSVSSWNRRSRRSRTALCISAWHENREQDQLSCSCYLVAGHKESSQSGLEDMSGAAGLAWIISSSRACHGT